MKGKLKSFKLKYILFLFVAAAAVTLPLRVYQLLTVVEAETGFFASNDISVYLLYGICGVFCLLTILFAFMSGQVPDPKLPVGKNKLLGVASGLFALGLLWSIVDNLVDLIRVFTGKYVVIGSEGLLSFLQEQGGFVVIIKIIAAFLGAIYLLVFTVSHFDGKASYREQRILALMPLAWCVCSLIGCLIQAISYIKMSELFFEMAMYLFLMLFLMAFARVCSGVSEKNTMWEIYAFGLPAALFALIVSVPRLIVLVMGKSAVAAHPFDASDLTVALFVILYIFASLGVGFNKEALAPQAREAQPVIREKQGGQE